MSWLAMTLKVIFKPPFALWFKGTLTAALLCPTGVVRRLTGGEVCHSRDAA